jgi:polyhydroxyalkanoate synthesis regulator phasin
VFIIKPRALVRSINNVLNEGYMTLDEGKVAFDELMTQWESVLKTIDNEADTRFKLIDHSQPPQPESVPVQLEIASISRLSLNRL